MIYLSSIIIILSLSLLSAIFWYSMETMSAIRACVGAEGFWAKSQKSAIYRLRKYAQTGDETEYQRFYESLKVFSGDKKARLSLISQHPDMEVAAQGFIDGQNSPEDVEEMSLLFRRFYRNDFVRQSIDIWTKADECMDNLIQLSGEIHMTVSGTQSDDSMKELNRELNRLEILDDKLQTLENDFSYTLGKASRWARNIFMSLFVAVASVILLVIITSYFVISRNFKTRVSRLTEITMEIARGEYNGIINTGRTDELGRLEDGFKEMQRAIRKSLGQLNDSITGHIEREKGLTIENEELKERLTGHK